MGNDRLKVLLLSPCFFSSYTQKNRHDQHLAGCPPTWKDPFFQSCGGHRLIEMELYERNDRMIALITRPTRREILALTKEAETKLASLQSELNDERLKQAGATLSENAVAIMEVIPADDFKTMHAALMCIQLGLQISRLNFMEVSD